MLRKYESINLKAKLVQLGEKSGPNSYCLGGIGFSIVYFSVKWLFSNNFHKEDYLFDIIFYF